MQRVALPLAEPDSRELILSPWGETYRVGILNYESEMGDNVGIKHGVYYAIDKSYRDKSLIGKAIHKRNLDDLKHPVYVICCDSWDILHYDVETDKVRVWKHDNSNIYRKPGIVLIENESVDLLIKYDDGEELYVW